VYEFNDLGNVVTWVVCKRCAAEKAFMEKRKLFWSCFDRDLRRIIIKCFVWSVALYVAETSNSYKLSKFVSGEEC